MFFIDYLVRIKDYEKCSRWVFVYTRVLFKLQWLGLTGRAKPNTTYKLNMFKRKFLVDVKCVIYLFITVLSEQRSVSVVLLLKQFINEVTISCFDT